MLKQLSLYQFFVKLFYYIPIWVAKGSNQKDYRLTELHKNSQTREKNQHIVTSQ